MQREAKSEGSQKRREPKSKAVEVMNVGWERHRLYNCQYDKLESYLRLWLSLLLTLLHWSRHYSRSEQVLLH